MELANLKPYYLFGIVVFASAALAYYALTVDTSTNHAAKVMSSSEQEPSNINKQTSSAEKFVEDWKKDIKKSIQEKMYTGGDQQLSDARNVTRDRKNVENTQSINAERQDKLLEEMVALASGEGIDFGEIRPAPSGNNINSVPIGEYADQIDQAVINEQAKTQGIELPEVSQDSHPPTSVNLSLKPSGEHSEQIDQEAIYDAQAKSDGF